MVLKNRSFSSLRQTQSPLKMIKTIFISPLKLFSLSRYLSLYLEFWFMLKNSLRSKDNHAMKFGQLIEFKMRNIFLKKLYTKCCGELLPDFLLKTQNGAYHWINSLKFCKFLFYCMPN